MIAHLWIFFGLGRLHGGAKLALGGGINEILLHLLPRGLLIVLPHLLAIRRHLRRVGLNGRAERETLNHLLQRRRAALDLALRLFEIVVHVAIEIETKRGIRL
ncbi:MAG TPA: hypothetical protein VMW17_16095 [Candidatus Binatia bacterium]|nr:hypothetical protein [Candidatus Binatia bacterium]